MNYVITFLASLGMLLVVHEASHQVAAWLVGCPIRWRMEGFRLVWDWRDFSSTTLLKRNVIRKAGFLVEFLLAAAVWYWDARSGCPLVDAAASIQTSAIRVMPLVAPIHLLAYLFYKDKDNNDFTNG